MARALHHRASWCFGAAVWLCAALVFPLLLGSAGAPVVALAAYAAIAAGLLLAGDVLHDPGSYRGTGAVRAQAGPFLLAVAVPATLAFVVGQALAPIERAVEEQVCQLGGLAVAADQPLEELGDGLDPTADCAPGGEG